MLLCIDIGNTNTVIGVYHEEKLINHWRMSTDRKKTRDEYVLTLLGLFKLYNIDPHNISGVIISSVVPPVNHIFISLSQELLGIKPLLLTSTTYTGVSIDYQNPEEVGSDRIANVVAVKHRYGLPAVVVDLGTATTVDAISKDSRYLGGAINVGVELSIQALFDHTAKLPHIQLTLPQQALGKTTQESMLSGILFGAADSIDGLVNRIKRELEGDPIVIATGGLAKFIAPLSQTIQHTDEHLTMEGLRYIFEMNRK
jgi:type III pantothenate kinase